MTTDRTRTHAGLEPAAAAPAHGRPAALSIAARDAQPPAPQSAPQASVAPGAGQLRRAKADPSAPLPAALAALLSQRVGADFSGVRVHRGEASHAAAESLGANAFTLGRHVHLSRAADNLSAADHDALLAHEAVHSAQQGGGDVDLRGEVALGRPGDASELEAERIASTLKESPLPVAHDRMAATPLAQRHAPRLQRDLKGTYAAPDGRFDLKLKTESHKGATSGMSGAIEFTPDAEAPDAKSIRLLQIRTSTAEDHPWTREPNREISTPADKSLRGRLRSPAKADAPASPYFASSSQSGSKEGRRIAAASQWDFPGADFNVGFKFETVARAADTGYIYASLTWGFRISDAAQGSVTGEYAEVSDSQSGVFNAAAKQFDDFYRTPGAASAPKK